MQNIKLWLINERGEAIDKATLNFVPVMHALFELDTHSERYPFLSGIDPYGYTYFNVRQMPRVIDELRTAKGEISALKEIEETIAFLVGVKQHMFAKFIGD